MYGRRSISDQPHKSQERAAKPRDAKQRSAIIEHGVQFLAGWASGDLITVQDSDTAAFRVGEHHGHANTGKAVRQITRGCAQSCVRECLVWQDG